jgi:hypothetical protein
MKWRDTFEAVNEEIPEPFRWGRKCKTKEDIQYRRKKKPLIYELINDEWVPAPSLEEKEISESKPPTNYKHMKNNAIDAVGNENAKDEDTRNRPRSETNNENDIPEVIINRVKLKPKDPGKSKPNVKLKNPPTTNNQSKQT